MITPYDPTTKNIIEPTFRLKPKQLANLMVGRMVEGYNKNMTDAQQQERDLKHYIKEARMLNKRHKDTVKKIHNFDINKEEKDIIVDIRKELRRTKQLKFIDDFRIVEGILYFTTKPIHFDKDIMLGSDKHGFIQLSQKTLIGRFVVRLDFPAIIECQSTDYWLQIVNLNYQVIGDVSEYRGGGFSHPVVNNNKLCYGNTKDKFRKMLQENFEPVEAIGLLIDIILSGNDGDAWVGWQEWLDKRRTIKQLYKKGQAISNWKLYNPRLITKDHNIYLK